jgi:hypothetical protein
VQTDRTVPNNKLNIMIHDNNKKKRICMLIDIARVITVIIEVIGTMSKSLRQYLSNIP